MTTELRRIGSYLETDAEGFLITLADAARIGAAWRPAVDRLITGYRKHFGTGLHSVYVRGSLVKGQAVEGFSDLDSFAVLQTGVESSDTRDWARTLEADIVLAFPIVAGVETDTVPMQDILDRSNYYAFALKTEAACVYGDDLAAKLEPYRITPEIAFQTRYFSHHLGLFRREYADEPEAEKPEFVAWLMRRFLRLGMELVMIEEGRFTRDLYLCHESFAKHYPERAGEMYRALELAINPETGPEVEGYIGEFGGWLEDEAKRSLESWGVSTEGL